MRRSTLGFFAKLKRARDKAQYLRIQAGCLTRSRPQIALTLLERYLATGDNFGRAQAYVDQANALLALGEVERALASYELALAREQEFLNLSQAMFPSERFKVACCVCPD
jgi:tetratricopeptide (TPR) repeat protein